MRLLYLTRFILHASHGEYCKVNMTLSEMARWAVVLPLLPAVDKTLEDPISVKKIMKHLFEIKKELIIFSPHLKKIVIYTFHLFCFVFLFVWFFYFYFFLYFTQIPPFWLICCMEILDTTECVSSLLFLCREWLVVACFQRGLHNERALKTLLL